MLSSWRDVERRGVETLLDRMGLQRRQSALRPVLWVTAGAVLGGCAVYVLAPRAGATIRIGVEKLRQAREWAESRIPKKSTATSAANHVNGETHESV